MKAIKIKIHKGKILRFKRKVSYRIKSNVPENMVNYIEFLRSHHGYTFEKMATNNTLISNYFEPYLELKKID